jgi:hypothetical protein
MDNKTPGLNFPVANFVSNGDLDIESMELLPGASSALYDWRHEWNNSHQQ